MSAELDVLIKVRREGERVLADLNRDLADVGRQGQQTSQQLSTTDKALGNMKTAALGFGAAMATAFATEHVVNFAKSSVAAASNLNETISKSNQVFGENAQAVQAWADGTATSIGLSEEASLSAAATLADMFNTMNLGIGPATSMSQNLVELSADVASFHNAAGGAEEVLEAMRSGLIGESEPMRRFGVLLSEAAVQAKAAELGLGGMNGELTEAEKVQARYAIIVEQTASAHGDFARTMDDQANQARIAAAQWEDMQANLGQGLLPVTLEITRAANDLMASPMFQGGVEGAAEEMAALSSSARDVRTAVDALLGPMLDLADSIGALGPLSEGASVGLREVAKSLPGGQLLQFNDNVQVAKGLLQEFGVVAEESGDGWSDYSLMLLAGATNADEVGRAIAEMTLELGLAKTEIAETATTTDDLIDAKRRYTQANTANVEAIINEREYLREATLEGHRHIAMLDESAGAYDAATVAAGILANTQNDLTAINDIMNQRIDESAAAISHWEGRVSDVDTALGYLDDMLADGIITQEEYGEKTDALRDFKERLAGGIENDLIPAFVDEQIAAAELQSGLDDLDQALQDGTISQEEHAAKARDLRDAFAEQQDPVGTLIDKIGDLIDILIELEDEDPNVEITANADAVRQAIEDMRAYAANNPINVPIYGYVAGGNDAPGPGVDAGRSDIFNVGLEMGRSLSSGLNEGIDSTIKPVEPIVLFGSEEDAIEYVTGLWEGAVNAIESVFVNNPLKIFSGEFGAQLQEEIRAYEAFLESLLQAGFAIDSPEYVQAYQDYLELLRQFELAMKIAGTESAQDYWDAWLEESRDIVSVGLDDIGQDIISSAGDTGADAGEEYAIHFLGTAEEIISSGMDQINNDIVSSAMDTLEPEIMEGPQEPSGAFNDPDTGGPVTVPSGGGSAAPVGEMFWGSMVDPQALAAMVAQVNAGATLNLPASQFQTVMDALGAAIYRDADQLLRPPDNGGFTLYGSPGNYYVNPYGAQGPGGGMNLTVPIVLDGQVISQYILNNIDKQFAAGGG